MLELGKWQKSRWLRFMVAAGLVLTLIMAASPAGAVENGEISESAPAMENEAMSQEQQTDENEAPAQDNQAGPEGIKVFIDSEQLMFEVAPIVEYDRILVPVKGIFEALGARVAWQANTQGIVVQKGDSMILMHLYHPLAYINQEAVVLDVPPVAREERTFVPLRFVSQAMDYEVQWNPATQTVSINQAPQAAEAAWYLQ